MWAITLEDKKEKKEKVENNNRLAQQDELKGNNKNAGGMYIK